MRIRGITLFPFVFVRDKSELKDKVLVNHEKIHIRQQFELLILPFYIWYLLDFGFQYYKFRNRNEAYLNIVFEKEAYSNENNMDYLRERSVWNFLRYN